MHNIYVTRGDVYLHHKKNKVGGSMKNDITNK